MKREHDLFPFCSLFMYTIDMNELSDYRTAILQKIQNSEFEISAIDKGVNFTIQDICTRYKLPYNRKSKTLTIGTSEMSTSLPGDCQEIITLGLKGPSAQNIKRGHVPPGEFEEIYPDPSQNSPGRPYSHTIEGPDIIWARPSDKSYQLKVKYFYTPPYLENDNDSPILPLEWFEAIMTGAIAYCFEQDTDYSEAQVHRNRHNQLAKDLADRSVNRYSGTRKLRITNFRSRRR